MNFWAECFLTVYAADIARMLLLQTAISTTTTACVEESLVRAETGPAGGWSTSVDRGRYWSSLEKP